MMEKISVAPTIPMARQLEAKAPKEGQAQQDLRTPQQLQGQKTQAQGVLKSSKAGSENPESGETTFAGQMEAQAAALASATAGPTNAQMPKLAGSSDEVAKPFVNPLAGKLATGSKTGAMIAGLQPRASMQRGIQLGKDWVFDGADQNPNLKGLLTPNSPAALPPTLNEGVAGKNLKDEKIQTEQVRGDLASRDVSVQNLVQAGVNKAMLESAAVPMNVSTQAAAQPAQMQINTGALSDSRLASIAYDANGKIGDLSGGEKAESPAQEAMENSEQGNLEGQHEINAAMIAKLLSGLDHTVTQGDRAQGQPAQAGSSHSLSGGEFLSMLSAVKAGANQGTQSDAGGDASQGFSQGKNVSSVFSGAKKKVSLAEEGDSSALEKSATGAAALAGGSRLLSTEGDGVPKEMRAQVTQGGDTQNRMATDGLMSLSNNIRNMTPQGGGEIRVRLNPGNLGELNVRVVTDGKQVGLQIQASDEKAKKILELSMSDLRESLSRQHLNLGHIELTVGSSQSGSFAGNSGNESQSQNPFQSSNQSLGNMLNGGGNSQNGSGSQEGGSAREAWNASPLRTAVPGGITSSGSSSALAAKASGRLDVQA